MPQPATNTVTTIGFTLLALIAFAANSVLCRLALGQQTIDAASFTVLRLLSGALVLLLLLLLRANRRNKNRQQTTLPNQHQSPSQKKGPFHKKGQKARSQAGSWLAASYLFGYAIAFSYAYNSLDTATGALILFGSVQLTMISVSLYRGERLQPAEWLGLIIAFGGFVYLLLPGLTTPALQGFVLMTLAGIAWGGYTLKGKGSSDPLADTAYNFVRTLPWLLALVITGGALVLLSNGDASLFEQLWQGLSGKGIALAIASGALASGIGYSLWYQALTALSTSQAASVQLLVPVLAAFGGILFVDEAVSLRLMVAALLILGGIALTVFGKRAASV
ncbi:MAG: DMT family transporter [Motiliproteus sp.]